MIGVVRALEAAPSGISSALAHRPVVPRATWPATAWPR